MYTYDNFDRQIVSQRVAQFRDQTQRYLDGKITDEQFLPLRLQNGLYVQRLAPMMPHRCALWHFKRKPIA